MQKKNITNSSVYYIPSEKVAYRIIDGEAVALNLENGLYYSLNKVGSRIWELLDGKNSFGNIVDTIFDEYKAEKDIIIKETEELLEDLLSQKLIEEVK